MNEDHPFSTFFIHAMYGKGSTGLNDVTPRVVLPIADLDQKDPLCKTSLEFKYESAEGASRIVDLENRSYLTEKGLYVPDSSISSGYSLVCRGGRQKLVGIITG